MIIACDVKGTLEGPMKQQILAMLAYLHSLGHDVRVWSNSYGYAIDAVQDNNLPYKAESKTDKWTREEENFYDLAFEDDVQQGQWLAAKKFIFVKDIPENVDEAIEMLKKVIA
jgi:hydroxymethylpyrimidine pyrophosphatase-like HAD family hydrolase